VGGRISNRNVDRAFRDIERERRPNRTTAFQPRISVAPGLYAGLAFIGDGVEAPDLGAVVEPERADPSFYSKLASCRPDDDEIFVDQRRHREAAFILLHVDNGALPEDLAGLGVQREQIAVVSPANDLAVLERHTSRQPPAFLAFGTAIEAPTLLKRRRVERNRRVGRRYVHPPTVNDWIGVKRA